MLVQLKKGYTSTQAITEKRMLLFAKYMNCRRRKRILSHKLVWVGLIIESEGIQKQISGMPPASSQGNKRLFKKR